MNNTIALVSNTAWYIYNFRLSLAQSLKDYGFRVLIVAPEDEYYGKLKALGFTCVPWELNRRGLNPLEEWWSLVRLLRIYRWHKPCIAHHFTIKCCIYGTLAAFLNGSVIAVNSVTGLGHTVLSTSPRFRLVRPSLLRIWSRTLSLECSHPVFQNEIDLGLLSAYSPRLRDKSIVCAGSGVNTRKFSPVSDEDKSLSDFRVTFAGRLIEQKGIYEFVAAARLVKQRYPSVEFFVCGEVDRGNRSAIGPDTVAAWEREGVATFFGHVDDIRDVFKKTRIFVLPSYREGLSRVLLEASAMGLPMVATNVPGCREVVIHGKTGLLVPAKNVESLAFAIAQLIDQPELRAEYGANARQRATELFDERYIISDTFALYRRLVPSLFHEDLDESEDQVGVDVPATARATGGAF